MIKINTLLITIYLILNNNISFAKEFISDALILEAISKNISNKEEDIEKDIVIKEINKKYNSESNIAIKLITPKIDQKKFDQSKKAYKMLKKGYYEISTELYKELYKQYPKDLDFKFSLAFSHHKLNQLEKAKTHYYQLINSNYKYKNKAINNILDIVINQPNVDPYYILKKLYAQDSNNPYILSKLAMYYEKNNKLNEAIILLKKVINSNKNETIHKINLAILYDKNSEYQNAAILYQEILEEYQSNKISSKNIPIFEIKNRLEYIKNHA